MAKSLEILGDRWTLLIVRDMLTGTTHFNDLERGLPGISRALLASRLRQLQRAGIIEKRLIGAGRSTTSYQLTPAGQQLFPVISSIRAWGETWAFGDPTPEELNPVLLMWWLRSRAERDLLPAKRVVAQFDFHGAAEVSFWLILSKDDVTLCLTDPGYDVNLLVSADLATLFRVWGRRIDYREALARQGLSVAGVPSLVRAFPRWFGWDAKATPAEVRTMSAS
ncbi:MAG TPA: helix-turn-helix domain-containing protein [Ktedonobacterales bacterium]